MRLLRLHSAFGLALLSFSASAQLAEITSVYLVDSETNLPITGSMVDGERIGITIAPEFVNLVAEVSASTDAVTFSIVGGDYVHEQNEGVAPYALYGDSPRGNFHPGELDLGIEYTLTATPYDGEAVAGPAFTLRFTLIFGTMEPSPTPTTTTVSRGHPWPIPSLMARSPRRYRLQSPQRHPQHHLNLLCSHGQRRRL